MDFLARMLGANAQGMIVTLTFAIWLAYIIIHCAFALAVLANARGRDTVFVGSGTWFLATLLMGPMMAVAYWVLNCSTLNAEAKA